MQPMAIICGAEREIKLDIGCGDTGGDVNISSVDGVPMKSSTFNQADHWIGGAGHVLIMSCRRCVGSPERKCDLNTQTWGDLKPQTIQDTSS